MWQTKMIEYRSLFNTMNRLLTINPSNCDRSAFDKARIAAGSFNQVTFKADHPKDQAWVQRTFNNVERLSGYHFLIRDPADARPYGSTAGTFWGKIEWRASQYEEFFGEFGILYPDEVSKLTDFYGNMRTLLGDPDIEAIGEYVTAYAAIADLTQENLVYLFQNLDRIYGRPKLKIAFSGTYDGVSSVVHFQEPSRGYRTIPLTSFEGYFPMIELGMLSSLIGTYHEAYVYLSYGLVSTDAGVVTGEGKLSFSLCSLRIRRKLLEAYRSKNPDFRYDPSNVSAVKAIERREGLEPVYGLTFSGVLQNNTYNSRDAIMDGNMVRRPALLDAMVPKYRELWYGIFEDVFSDLNNFSWRNHPVRKAVESLGYWEF